MHNLGDDCTKRMQWNTLYTYLVNCEFLNDGLGFTINDSSSFAHLRYVCPRILGLFVFNSSVEKRFEWQLTILYFYTVSRCCNGKQQTINTKDRWHVGLHVNHVCTYVSIFYSICSYLFWTNGCLLFKDV